MQSISRIVVHCSDSKFGDVNVIRKWHTDPPRNWKDIGYHYVIPNGFPTSIKDSFNPILNGLIQAGRFLNNDIFIGVEETGAHAGGAMNFNSIGICMIGVNNFTLEQFESLYAVCRLWYKMIPEIEIIGHYQVPNSNKTCPNFDVSFLNNLVKNEAVSNVRKELIASYKNVLKVDSRLLI